MNESKQKTVFEERDEAIWLMNKASMELNKVKLQLAATQEALAQVQRESAELRERYEAARKVADAAVDYYESDEDETADFNAQAFCVFDDCVREYQRLIKPPPLSPSQQAAIDRGIAKAEKVEKAWETN